MNAGKYKNVVGAVAAVCLIAFPAIALAAVTPISNLRVSHAGDFVELDVIGGGNTLCDHKTEPARNGRPFRIVLDFCDADHALGQLNFSGLPQTRIKAIRTSQFSVSPDHIVRVVLDMTDEVTYSVRHEGARLVVRFVDPNRASFPAWEARPGLTDSPPKLAVESKRETKTPESVSVPKAKTEVAVKPQPVKTTTGKEHSTADRVSMPPAGVSTAPMSEPTVAKADKAKADQPVGKPETVTPVKPAFEPPSVPLVLAPAFDKVDAPATDASTIIAKTDDVTVSKESMVPMGPKEMSATELAAQDRTDKSLWASTTPAPASKTRQPAQTGEEPDAVDADAAETPATLLDRLKTKFFGNQVAPRPYTTVEGEFSGSDSYGPPTPTTDLDREGLLDRIQQTKQRVADGGLEPGEGGAGGIPTRTVLYYDDMNRRDPFQPLVTGLRSGFMTDALPDIETLRLVGVLHDDHEPLALFENVEGFSYIMRAGDKVNNGSLVTIQGNRALFRVEEYGWSHVVALQLTPRGTDPSKTLGMGPREYPKRNDESGETDTQGSNEE